MRILVIAALFLLWGLVVAQLPNYEKSQYAVAKLLPLVTFSVPESWAGNIPINESSYGNDSLFFWLWGAENGEADEHLIIWLNGGPGCSSLLGIFKEHGPIIFPGNSTMPQQNPYSWTKVANVLYVDQPVGTGFSVGDYGATSNAEDTTVFIQWLAAFFLRFPEMKLKKIHLLGESYAGIFIPYIAELIQQQSATLGVKLTSIGIGDGTWANADALTNVVATSFIKEHLQNPGTQITGDVLTVLEQADIDCGFTSVLSQLTYPPQGTIVIPGNPEDDNYKRNIAPPDYDVSKCDFTNGTQTAAQVAYIINSTSLSDGCYGNCATFEAAYNYFVDDPSRCFNAYNIDVDCNSTLYSDDAFAAYLNLGAVKAAIHVPADTVYTQCSTAIFAALSTRAQRATPPAYFIIPALLEAGIRVNIWSGSVDYLLNPLGTELAIQNMTWNGAQGFHQRPSRKFYDREGQPAGVWEVERGLGFHKFDGAGHRTAQDVPSAAFAFVQSAVVRDKEHACS